MVGETTEDTHNWCGTLKEKKETHITLRVVNSQWQKSIRIQGERLSGLGRKMVKSEPGFTTADVPEGQKKVELPSPLLSRVKCGPRSNSIGIA